jgi:hypothetical protein
MSYEKRYTETMNPEGDLKTGYLSVLKEQKEKCVESNARFTKKPMMNLRELFGKFKQFTFLYFYFCAFVSHWDISVQQIGTSQFSSQGECRQHRGTDYQM